MPLAPWSAGGGDREDVALSYVYADSGCVAASPDACVSCEPVCVCVSLVRVVIICPASTHTALVSSPSLAVLHLSTYLPTSLRERTNAHPRRVRALYTLARSPDPDHPARWVRFLAPRPWM